MYNLKLRQKFAFAKFRGFYYCVVSLSHILCIPDPQKRNRPTSDQIHHTYLPPQHSLFRCCPLDRSTAGYSPFRCWRYTGGWRANRTRGPSRGGRTPPRRLPGCRRPAPSPPCLLSGLWWTRRAPYPAIGLPKGGENCVALWRREGFHDKKSKDKKSKDKKSKDIKLKDKRSKNKSQMAESQIGYKSRDRKSNGKKSKGKVKTTKR